MTNSILLKKTGGSEKVIVTLEGKKTTIKLDGMSFRERYAYLLKLFNWGLNKYVGNPPV